MSTRMMARSSSNRNSASALASSVLPTPVGPRNRNDPVGRSGSAMPARDLRTASDTACTALAWPTSRRPSSASIRSSFAVSPSSSRPAGMPVQEDTTSATSSGPTSSLTMGAPTGTVGSSGDSGAPGGGRAPPRDNLRTPPRAGRRGEFALQRRNLPVHEPGRGLEVGVPLRALDLPPEVVQALLQLADPVEAGFLLLPAGGERGQLLLAVGQIRAEPFQPLLAGRVSLPGQGQFLHLHPVHRPLQLVDFDGP